MFSLLPSQNTFIKPWLYFSPPSGFSFASYTLDTADHSIIRLKKVNCMSQSCRACLFFGACLIQQNSSFNFFFFACLIFSRFFFFLMNLLVKIYMKRHDRHNKTLCTTDFFSSVFCLVSCSSINQVLYSILKKVVTNPNLTHLLLREKKNVKKKKKNAFRSGLPICHKLWDKEFFSYSLIISLLHKF